MGGEFMLIRIKIWREINADQYYNPLNGTRNNEFKGLVDISVPGLPFAVVAQC